jgi:hypothetical protein
VVRQLIPFVEHSTGCPWRGHPLGVQTTRVGVGFFVTYGGACTCGLQKVFDKVDALID